MREFIRKCGNMALDLAAPDGLYCACCGKITDRSRTYGLCNDCMKGIKWIGARTCAKCGKRLSDMNPGDRCFSCREHEHSFDCGYTCAEYGTHERAMIYSLKYDGRSDIADKIGEIMFDRMSAEFGAEELSSMYDIVLPVPVHRSKRRIRGYNQAGLIAGRFAARAGLRCNDNILYRKRGTAKMKALDPDQRRENIRGAFAVRDFGRNDVSGRRILLIDDIYTTGATVDELAHILKEPCSELKNNRADNGPEQRGASRVDVLTFAAGGDIVKDINKD